MFSGKKQKNDKAFSYNPDRVSILAETVKITGDIEAEGDIRIDGTVHGNILCKAKVVIVNTGKVLGDIHAENIDIHGMVDGNIYAAGLLSLKSHCHVKGDIRADGLQIESNAVFNGRCHMQQEQKQRFIEEQEWALKN